MIKLGVSAEQAKPTSLAQAAPANRTALITKDNATLLNIPDSFDVAWRRVGVALDRTGFTVEDRDRAQGLYFVRYVDTAAKQEKGFFGKLFSASGPETGPVKYRLVVRNAGSATEVSVQNAMGQAENSPVSQRILKLLADDLR